CLRTASTPSRFNRCTGVKWLRLGILILRSFACDCDPKPAATRATKPKKSLILPSMAIRILCPPKVRNRDYLWMPFLRFCLPGDRRGDYGGEEFQDYPVDAPVIQ